MASCLHLCGVAANSAGQGMAAGEGTGHASVHLLQVRVLLVMLYVIVWFTFFICVGEAASAARRQLKTVGTAALFCQA